MRLLKSKYHVIIPPHEIQIINRTYEILHGPYPTSPLSLTYTHPHLPHPLSLPPRHVAFSQSGAKQSPPQGQDFFFLISEKQNCINHNLHLMTHCHHCSSTTWLIYSLKLVGNFLQCNKHSSSHWPKQQKILNSKPFDDLTSHPDPGYQPSSWILCLSMPLSYCV